MDKTPIKKTFLRAEWRKLAMANYAIDPKLLGPYLPSQTELDIWENNCYVSLVGFMFLNTRLKGFRIPFHTHFEEVNLRFYVRFQDGTESKRGVVFIREIVPKHALSFVANTFFNKNYETMPMRHKWETHENQFTASYQWKKKNWHSLSVTTETTPLAILPGSEAEFITEHYWGYTKNSETKTGEYGVEHPRWEVYPMKDYHIEVDFGELYGNAFGFLGHQQPTSVFLAEGSEIKVMSGREF